MVQRPMIAFVRITSPLHAKHVRLLETFSTPPTCADAISVYGVLSLISVATSPMSSIIVEMKEPLDGVMYFFPMYVFTKRLSKM